MQLQISRAFAVLLVLIPSIARAALCENCFAVFVMPDTQDYVREEYQPAGSAHLDLITRYVCNHRKLWYEPSTSKLMPIVMVLHLGDLVQTGRAEAEWERAAAAFDNLDECGMPYIAVMGNHDADGSDYHQGSELFNLHFGPQRWAPYQCVNLAKCEWHAGRWFLGAGDLIPAHARNNADGDPGPREDQPGRHRAAIIPTPNGQRYLFMGLDLAFDFPPAATPMERNDSAWPKKMMKLYSGVPTIIVHHTLLSPSGSFRDETFDSDSLETMRDIWDEMVEPFPQVLMTLNGHWLGQRENEWVMPTSSGQEVFSIFRNYQADGHSYSDGGIPDQGDGWNPIVVFDPDAGEIRIRSYRIEDRQNDGTHDGRPGRTTRLDKDFNGRGEVVFSYSFPDARPERLDNCPDVPNPSQTDSDGSGAGDACTVPALPASIEPCRKLFAVPTLSPKIR